MRAATRKASAAGQGVRKFPDGCTYVGTFAEDKYDGIGTFTYANGDIYEGSWLAGEKNGDGKYFFKESASTFEGTWESGTFVSGKWIYKDGSSFEGSFKDGAPAGKGLYSFYSNLLSQTGEFKDGKWFGDPITPL